MDNERIEIFREHFEECLRHFGKTFSANYPPGSRNRCKLLKPLIDFCGVGRQTAQKWIDDMGIPRGELMMKLSCYLDLNGYRIIELERMPRVIRGVLELIGFSILSANDMAVALGYEVQSLYDIFLREAGTSQEKEAMMFELWKGKKTELETKNHEAFESIHLARVSRATSESEVIGQQVLSLMKSGEDISARRNATLAIIRGLRLLLDEGLFSNLTSKEISGISNDERLDVLQLLNHFTALSSKLIQVRD